MRTKYGAGKLVLEILLILLALLVLYPFYLTLINSFKTNPDVTGSLLSFPKTFTFDNFSRAWRMMHYPRAFMNSLIVTVAAVALLLVISSMAAYRLVRSPGKASQIIFYLVLSAMVIPFQTIIIPAIKLAKDLHLVNSLPGLIVMYLGFLVPMSLFLFHGFIKGIPYELEESAYIDGCGPFRMFFQIVLPLLAPITTTIAIINALGVFNDFMLPLIMISTESLRTLPLAGSVFFGSYSMEWNLIMASLTITLVPIVIFFLFMQRYIVQGLTAGAVKG